MSAKKTDAPKLNLDGQSESDPTQETTPQTAAVAAQPMTMAPDGKPFPNKESADKFIKSRELDPASHKAFKHQGGYCVFNLTGWPNEIIETFRAAKEAEASASASLPKAMTYSWVTFQAKGNSNDETEVPLSLNGTTIISQREQRIILPDSYLEVADHTIKSQYEQKPGHKRKIVGKIRKFIYQRHASATLEEFMEFRKTGNAIRDKEFEEQARSGDRND